MIIISHVRTKHYEFDDIDYMHVDFEISDGVTRYDFAWAGIPGDTADVAAYLDAIKDEVWQGAIRKGAIISTEEQAKRTRRRAAVAAIRAAGSDTVRVTGLPDLAEYVALVIEALDLDLDT